MTHRKSGNRSFFAKEGFVSVSLSWIVLSIIGALPFVLSGVIPNPVDAMFEIQFKELVAADYGTPTMRKRFFMIARCDGRPIVWPKPTHAPAESYEVKTGQLKPYTGAYTQLDFSLPCPSIFDTAEEIN